MNLKQKVIAGVGSGFDVTFTGDNPADVFHTGGHDCPWRRLAFMCDHC